MNLKEKIKILVPEIFLIEFRGLKRKKEIRKYKGSGVICPFCEAAFKEFAPFGKNPRPNARCPKCDSLERHRLIFLFLKVNPGLFPLGKKLKLLHFAPEQVFFEYFSSRADIEYFPCDINPGQFSFDSNKKITKADVTNIPFEENFFDVIFCNHVLEHIPDDKLAMAELFRVMKKGGWGVFQVPLDSTLQNTYEDPSIISPEGREKAFGQYDHVRIYGQDFTERLKKSGFKVERINISKEFEKYGLNPDEDLFICSK